ncbi:hypothetical protein VSR01_16990 [Actinacidiphila sp. DG2A-62]|uniref:hypothetical protein n=1 Tax=Actinacidiphila sp. DG2A-62 TaxID=3108821 RepID=UPI002DBFFBC7|nr:hypothetical protein [Actinacidiphila sp. DG2A-62]MEC3995134.1 hypothetical protein [Actinacidiphila sp. DG2A-62]
MSDGSRLVNPQERGPNQLQLNDWVGVDGRAYRITNLRQVGVAGRMVDLAHHDPVYLAAGSKLTVFEVLPPPEPDDPGEELPSAGPAQGAQDTSCAGGRPVRPGRRGG